MKKSQKQAAIGFIFITMLIDITGWGIIIPVIPNSKRVWVFSFMAISIYDSKYTQEQPAIPIFIPRLPDVSKTIVPSSDTMTSPCQTMTSLNDTMTSPC